MTTLYTIGHSNRTLAEFIQLLHVHNIDHVVDIRTIPKSRYVPWFNGKELRAALKKATISYTHLPELGGLRHAQAESINSAWKNASFRGFADYMQTAGFYQGFKKLRDYLRQPGKTTIMCAEAVPWRCHRSLIADAVLVRGIRVLDIIGTTLHRHHLTSFAVVDRSVRPIKVYYP